MPVIKYYSRSQVGRKADDVEKIVLKSVNVKTAEEAKAISGRKDFVRFRMGVYTDIAQIIEIRKKEGKSDWYV